MKTERIVHSGKVLAVIIYSNSKGHKQGVHFYTPDDYSLQVGKHIYKAGKVISPHRHLPVKIEREVSLHEVLVIEKGRVKVTFFTDSGRKKTEKILNKGHMVLLMEGGHGFEFLKPTKMLEIKQGPYLPESKKLLDVKDER